MAQTTAKRWRAKVHIEGYMAGHIFSEAWETIKSGDMLLRVIDSQGKFANVPFSCVEEIDNLENPISGNPINAAPAQVAPNVLRDELAEKIFVRLAATPGNTPYLENAFDAFNAADAFLQEKAERAVRAERAAAVTSGEQA